MEKLVYVLGGAGAPDAGDDLRGELMSGTVPRLRQLGGRGITVSVHDSDAAQAPSPVPVPAREDPHVAEVSVWLGSYDRCTGADEAGRRGPAVRRLPGDRVPVRGLRDDAARAAAGLAGRGTVPRRADGLAGVDGIVEEAWPSAAHVADPMLFFSAGGDPGRAAWT